MPLPQTENQSQSTNLTDLLTAPLNSIVEANSKMAITQTNFLLAYCFNKVNDHYEPVMIKMVLTNNVITPGIPATADQPEVQATFKEVETTFNLPLLTIIPLNSLAVESGNIDINLEVTGFQKNEHGIELLTKVTQKAEESSTQYQSYPALALKASVSQLPLPQGLLTIIQAFTSSISPITLPESQ